jgi:hypothetical protein
MMLRSAAAIVISLVSIEAHAQGLLDGRLDDLKFACEVATQPKELRVINATAFLVRNDWITQNPNGTYKILGVESFTRWPDDNGNAHDVCDDSFLYGETHQYPGAARTAFLIDSDVVDGGVHRAVMMTAPHAPTFNPMNTKVVFRHSLGDANDPTCSNFTWDQIPASDVYTPIQTLANTYSTAPAGEYDFVVFQIDRPVPNRQPLKIRRSGRARVGDTLVVAGYPNYGGENVDTAAVMYWPNAPLGTGFPAQFPGMDILYNVHGLAGSSGSAVYNLDDDVVETAVAGYTSSSVTGANEDCTYVIQRGPGATNGPLVDVQALIHRAEVLVTPLDYVERVLPIDPTQNTFTNTYSATSAPGESSELLDIEQVSGPSGPHDPHVSLNIPLGFRNVPVGGLSFNVQTDVRDVDACGVFDYVFNVYDVTNDQNNLIRHHIEMGLREFTLEPLDGWLVNDVAAPFEATRTYTLKNVRPTATHIVVSPDGTLPDSELILVNGGAGYVTYDLAPAGMAGDTATFTLSLNQSEATATTQGVEYHGRVSIYNQPFNCSAASNNVAFKRDLTFKRGEQLFTATPAAASLPSAPPGQPYGAPARFDIDLSTAAPANCVGDLNLLLGMPTPGWTIANLAERVRIDITAPNGFTRTIWEPGLLPNSQYISTVDLSGTTVPALFLDDETAPPVGPNLLSSFDKKLLRGHWYVDVRLASGFGGAIVGSAALDFTRGACITP